jgi:hypothetical protein
MTTPTNSIGQFGRTLAFAERTMTAVLRRHLAERETTPETWYALRLIATDGPGLAREALSRDLEGSPTMTPDSTRQLLARLETAGLICGDAAVDLTGQGQDLYEELRAYVSEPTVKLLSTVDPQDIDTTIRTLQAITKRAAEELATAG